ncbi:MAG TPA: DedA family protein [Solirubrobacteraceae bacterium]|nr:DedA family protein [Solirubrobacteraceae bacterium]
MKLGPLFAAALIVAALLLRRPRLAGHTQIIATGVAAILVAWGSGTLQPPNLETAAEGLGATLGGLTYVVVGSLAFLETGVGIGLIAPGEAAVIIGGVTAGQGHTDLPVLIAIVWACALGGDLTSYVLGRRLGRGFLVRHGQTFRLTPARLGQVELFLARHGGKTIIVGRFIGVVRTLAPFVAGSSRMPARRFVPAATVASGAWSATFCILGYVSWQSLDEAIRLAKQGTFAFGALIAAVIAAVALHRTLRSRERRERVRAQVRDLPAALAAAWPRIPFGRRPATRGERGEEPSGSPRK